MFSLLKGQRDDENPCLAHFRGSMNWKFKIPRISENLNYETIEPEKISVINFLSV